MKYYLIGKNIYTNKVFVDSTEAKDEEDAIEQLDQQGIAGLFLTEEDIDDLCKELNVS